MYLFGNEKVADHWKAVGWGIRKQQRDTQKSGFSPISIDFPGLAA